MRPGLLLLLFLTACPPAEPPPGVLDAGSDQPAKPSTPCLHAFPDALEFGEIDAFTTAIGKVRITNSSPGTVLLHTTPVAAPWAVTPAQTVLSAGTSLLFDVHFEPTDSLLHFAELELTASENCTLKVPMRGLGAGTVTVSPPQLDFGVMEPGARKTLELQFINTRRIPVSLNQLGLVDVFASDGGRPPFTLDLDADVQLELPPLSSTLVRVTATPPAFDLFSATLTAGTAFGRINVALQVVGGRPRAELTPEAIDVPTVGFWAGSNPPSFVDRVVTLRNVGDAGSFSSALRLISPFTLVEALDGGAASELRVMTPDSAVFGGVPLGEATDLVLHLEPQSLGPRAFKVTLFTNDPFQSERVVTLSAVVMSLPACALQVAPLSVAFLTAIPDAGSVGEVRFTNTGNTRCVLDDVRLAPSFALGFELTAGDVSQIELAPGGVHVVTVRGPAQDDAFGRSGALLFHVFNRDTDQQFIGLRVTR